MWIRAWSLGRRLDKDSSKEEQFAPLGHTLKAVRSGLRRAVSAKRSERAQGFLSRRMDLVMRTRPLVVPGGQVTVQLVGMAVSWNVCLSRREESRVPPGPVTAIIQSQAKRQANIGKTGLRLRDRKGHRKGGSWPRRGGVPAQEGV